MVRNDNARVKMCRQKAAEAHALARSTQDSYLKDVYATVERSWLHLADSIARTERTITFLAQPPSQDPAAVERDQVLNQVPRRPDI
jgi:hypothetical protein